MNVGSVIVRGLLFALPVAGGFAAYTATQQRRWSIWSSALAASGAVLAGAVGGSLVEGVLQEQGVITGLKGWETPGDLRRSGNLYGMGILDVQRERLSGWETPGDLRRSGNLYGMRGQNVPRNVRQNWRSRGSLGLTEVRRYA